MAADAARVPDHQPKARIFVSYSRKDMAFADQLKSALDARDFEVLIDREEIYAFEDWWKRIQSLIGQSDTVVFALSPDSVKSDVALKEVDYAASLNKRFAPIVCRRVDDAAVPDALRRLNLIFIDGPQQFEAGVDRLVEALHTDIAWVRRHTQFGDSAHRWVEAGRPSGMLLRPPVLDQAEAWLAFRPGSAPAPTAETEAFIAQSRKVMLGTQRLRRIAVGSIMTLMMAVIVGLVGWINQAYITDQWRWWTVTRPYAAAQVWPYVLTEARERALKPGDSFKECAQDCPEMVIIPAGEFMMGSAKTEKGSFSNERPQHKVTIVRPFSVSKFDVTFDVWDACVSAGPCLPAEDQGYGRGSQPVVNVSWVDAKAFAEWLSKVTGKSYRLLSEAEWEYAERAGSTTAYFWGDDLSEGKIYCDGCDNNLRRPTPAGAFKPNAFGLYDMLGNLWQWVEDCYHDNYDGAPTDGSPWADCTDLHPVRGGPWNNAPRPIRSAVRVRRAAANRVGNVGFRVARDGAYASSTITDRQ